MPSKYVNYKKSSRVTAKGHDGGLFVLRGHFSGHTVKRRRLMFKFVVFFSLFLSCGFSYYWIMKGKYFDVIYGSFYKFNSNIFDYYSKFHSNFVLRKLRIETVFELSREKILEYSGLKFSNNCYINVLTGECSKILHKDFSVDLKNKLEAYPEIRRAEVFLHLPDAISLYVQARSPAVIYFFYSEVEKRKKYHLFDEMGVLIRESVTSEEKLKYLLISGNKANTNIQNLCQVLLPAKKLKSMIVLANYVGGRRWDLYLRNGVVVKLPQNKVYKALLWLEKIINRIEGGECRECLPNFFVDWTKNKTANNLSQHVDYKIIDMRFMPSKIFFRDNN